MIGAHRAALLLGLALLAFAPPAATAQEPRHLGGAWAGTWWMGKYEEPIEMQLVQSGATVSGTVAMLNYPEVGSSGGAGDTATVQSGRLDGDRLALVWLQGGRRFAAVLTVVAPGRLSGLGGEDGRTTVGFELIRLR